MMKSRGDGGENTLHRGSNEHPFHPGEATAACRGDIISRYQQSTPLFILAQKFTPTERANPVSFSRSR